MTDQTQRERLIELFKFTPILKSSDLAEHKIDSKTVQRMAESGEVRRIARGIYTRPDVEADSHHSLVEAQMIVDAGVLCLLSALSYHEIATLTPSRVWIAVPRGTRLPKIANHPIKVVTFSGEAFSEGIEEHEIESITVGVYSVAKTVADCFKYRNKLGNYVAVEALREALQARKASADEILHYAGICRVRNVMMPYLESVL
ncbi:MAG: transcriptional regulator [Spirochaetales bacterium]|jgi:predicted transcriptional regulator of viral defense system|nr:transcriptional regulator [Spirochaetales bacterium]